LSCTDERKNCPWLLCKTNNVTGRHPGPKQKLWAGYRVPSLQWTGLLPSPITKMDLTCCDAFSSSSVLSHTFSVPFMYLQFGHHPHPLTYLVFVSFVASIAELAHREKLRTQSLSHPAYLMPREPKRFRKRQVHIHTSISQQSTTNVMNTHQTITSHTGLCRRTWMSL